MPEYILIFDSVMLKQLKKIGKDKKLRQIISKMLDKIEALGPSAGKLLDSKLKLYEVKNNKPAVRLYFKVSENQRVFVFEYEIKKSQSRQQKTIDKLRQKLEP